jgi:hypothetical protein
MHEVLLLNEFNHIGKQDVLHKALLLEFAGPAFEGSYICRVCGQKIREIEYDTNLEFDDEGRPLVGRTVIEESGEDLDIDLRNETTEKQEDFPFRGDDLVLYTELNACFQACGMEVSVHANRDIFLRAVDALRAFKTYLPSEEKYEKGRKGQLDALKGEVKRKAFERQFPPFNQYYANAMIGCIGAVSVLEFQTSSISVPNPVTGCVFSLSGVPIDDTGSDTIDYVTCAIVTRKLAGALYSAASWSLETNMKRLTADVQASIVFALDVIMQKKKAAALSSITEIYRGRLVEKRRAAVEDLPSHKDILPASFRPLQQLPASMDSDPVKNIEAFQNSLQTQPMNTVAPIVIQRQHQLNTGMLQAMNAAAKKDVIANTNNPRSDGTGSFQRLAIVELRGRGYKSLDVDNATMGEIELINRSRKYLKRKDPTFSSNGTHIFVPWSAPVSLVPVPEIDVSILYKLFLKHCFQGPYEGYVHELGPDYVCRRCGFAYPSSLLYLTSSEISETNSGKLAAAIAGLATRREEIILARFREQGVNINEAAFLALDEKVRTRKILPAIHSHEDAPFLDSLSAMDAMFRNAADDWTIAKTTLKRLQAKKIVDEMDRKVEFGEFSSRYDRLFEEIQGVWNSLLIQGKVKGYDAKSMVQKAVAGFVKGTENPYAICRNLKDMFAAQAMQIAKSSPNVRPKAKKWFPTINLNHFRELEDIWSSHAAIVTDTIQIVDKYQDDMKVDIVSGFVTCSNVFSQFIQQWSKLKPNADFAENEYILIGRWATLVFIRDILTQASGPTSTIVNRWIIDTLGAMLDITGKYQLSDETILSEIAQREEKERNFFINKIDVLDGEMRKVELMKKKLGLGDWNVSAKNLCSYNSDWWDFEREQRAAMGIVPEFSGVGQAEEGGVVAPANPYSDVNDHRVAEHEDE